MTDVQVGVVEPIIRFRTADDLDQAGSVLVEVYELDGYPVEGVADPRAWLECPNSPGRSS
jgi:hypothetical protein